MSQIIDYQISLIITCGYNKYLAERLFSSLKKSHPCELIEIIIIHPSNILYSNEVFEPFANTIFLSYDDLKIEDNLQKAVNLSSSDFLIFLEDHVLPEDNLIVELSEFIKKESVSCLGFFVNPNQISYVSIAGYAINYGRFHSNYSSRVSTIPLAPINLMFYKKDLLAIMSTDKKFSLTTLQNELLALGKKIFFYNKTGIYHDQFIFMHDLLLEQFWFGWKYAGEQVKERKYSTIKRIFYSVAVLGKPFLRMINIWGNVTNCSKSYKLNPLLLIPIIMFTLIVSSFGEVLGYILGIRNSKIMVVKSELYNERN